jgi:tetratricopeptide (TPR) repeat protein
LKAETFRDKKDYGKMIEQAERAVKLDPNTGYNWYQLGCYLAMAEILDDAKNSLRRAFTLDDGLIPTARTDTDLDNLLHDQQFRKMIGLLRTK